MEKIRKFVSKYPIDEQSASLPFSTASTPSADLSSGLPAEIEARQKQYEYYGDKLLTFRRQIDPEEGRELFQHRCPKQRSTVVTDHKPQVKRSEAYQSESGLGKGFIRLLCETGAMSA